MKFGNLVVELVPVPESGILPLGRIRPRALTFDCEKAPPLGSRFSIKYNAGVETIFAVTKHESAEITPDEMRPHLKVPGYCVTAVEITEA